MQINSINHAQGFTGKRSNVDAYINLDDATLRSAASLKTIQSIDNKKHKRIDNTLMLALPLAGGLANAARAEKGLRSLSFLAGTTRYGLYLAGIAGAFGLMNAARKHSETINNIEEKNPMLSMLGRFVIGLGAADLALLGGAKAINKVVTSNMFNKLSQKAGALFANAKQYNIVDKTIKFANSSKNAIGNTYAKTPSALKSVIKGVAIASPLVIMFTALGHVINHVSVVSKTFNKNYLDMKDKQIDLARKRNAELQVQNDVLLTKTKNKEELSLVKNPTKDLPQEVLDKIEALKA